MLNSTAINRKTLIGQLSTAMHAMIVTHKHNLRYDYHYTNVLLGG